MAKLTYKQATALFNYDPETGIISLKASTHRKLKGAEVGSEKDNNGTKYLQVYANKDIYQAHRLIWLLMTGFWPKKGVEHKNNNGLDNRWANLQEALSISGGLDQDSALALLDYNKETGHLTWKTDRRGGAKAGDTVGTVQKKPQTNYIKASLYGKRYAAHRVIWLMETGSWPKHQIDHINGDGTDNRWVNLREVTNRGNQQNMRLPKHNTSGVIGVTKRGEKFKATIKAGGKNTYLGTFPTIEEAAKARKAAEIEYGFHENHGRV